MCREWLYFVVTNEAHTHLLANVDGRSGLGLPRRVLNMEEEGYASPLNVLRTELFQRFAEELCGLSGRVLYVKDLRYDEDSTKIITFEATSGPASTYYRWVENAEARHRARITGGIDGLTVQVFLDEQADPLVQRVTPWLCAGWTAQAEAWVRGELSRLGMLPTGPLVQVKTYFGGVTCRMATDAGDVYLKCATPVYLRDVAISQYMHHWVPGLVPRLLAADPVRGFMLTMAVAGQSLRDCKEPAIWENVLGEYAELQLRSLRLPPEAPLFDLRVERIHAEMDGVLEELEQLQNGADDRFDDRDLRQLRTMAPALRTLTERVLSFGVPSALEHGDFHPGNIFVGNGRPVFLDWACGGISHPFLSVNKLLRTAHREELAKAYLEPWKSYGSEESLLELFRLMGTWCRLNYAFADAQWVRAYHHLAALEEQNLYSYLAWSIRRRQYYLHHSFWYVLQPEFRRTLLGA